MSIIYDALKKVENKVGGGVTQDTRVTPSAKKKPPVKIFILFSAVLVLGFLAAKAFFPSSFIDKTTAPTPASRPVSTAKIPQRQAADIPKETGEKPVLAQNKTQDSDSLTLNGVFFSGQEGYALINNQILKEGDVIEGAKITRITLTEVELESRASKINLSTSGK